MKLIVVVVNIVYLLHVSVLFLACQLVPMKIKSKFVLHAPAYNVNQHGGYTDC